MSSALNCRTVGVLSLILLASHTTIVRAQQATLEVSTSGSCGDGVTCLGSQFGDCCSGKFFCGNDTTYCGAECNKDFGNCLDNAASISVNGNCGSTDPDSQICLGSTFGSCCSEKGFCGGTDAYCGTGCQPGFGDCAGGSNSSDIATSTSRSSETTSSASTSSSPTTADALSTTTDSAAAASITDSDPVTPIQSSKPVTERTSFKAGVGVAGAVVGLAIIGVLVTLFRCRQRKQKVEQSVTPGEDAETAGIFRAQPAIVTPSTAGPSPPSSGIPTWKSFGGSQSFSPVEHDAKPAELSPDGDRRPELMAVSEKNYGPVELPAETKQKS